MRLLLLTKTIIFCVIFLQVATIQTLAAEVTVITIAGSGKFSSTDGAVSKIAGIPGEPGFADGPGKVAQFNSPRAIACDRSGNLIVADRDNHRIRKVILP